jgi:hypothetical protein
VVGVSAYDTVPSSPHTLPAELQAALEALEVDPPGRVEVDRRLRRRRLLL